MTISKRVQQIDVSGVRKMFDIAKKLKNPCNLSIGQPDFDTPDRVKQACIASIQSGQNRYTQTQGIDELRQALFARFEAKGAPQEEIIATHACTGGFTSAILSICDEGDEVIIPDPYFVMWKDMLRLMGVTPRFCDTYPDFRWKRETLEACITPKTKAIVLSSPGNPTGVMATEEELKMLADVAKKHDLWIIYDEIYELYVYDRPHLNMSNYYKKTITLGGFSKSHSMAGWRVGYAAGPKVVIDQMMKAQQYTYLSISSPAQWGALEAIRTPMDHEVARYEKHRDYVIDRLGDRFEITRAEGGHFLFIKVPTDETADEFVTRALEQELVLSSGHAFSQKNTHFRVSFSASMDNLERGCDLLLSMTEMAEVCS